MDEAEREAVREVQGILIEDMDLLDMIDGEVYVFTD